MSSASWSSAVWAGCFLFLFPRLARTSSRSFSRWVFSYYTCLLIYMTYLDIYNIYIQAGAGQAGPGPGAVVVAAAAAFPGTIVI
ncbi:hypothetical protein GGS20DRAFT_112558 [Poronia punctata]|nr:hypothetical protein GGS20DRAFT_112558 [Poronia punctata]